jgi:hypothetical protein
MHALGLDRFLALDALLTGCADALDEHVRTRLRRSRLDVAVGTELMVRGVTYPSYWGLRATLIVQHVNPRACAATFALTREEYAGELRDPYVVVSMQRTDPSRIAGRWYSNWLVTGFNGTRRADG